MQNTQMYRCSILCSLSSSLFCNNKIISLLYELVNLMTLLTIVYRKIRGHAPVTEYELLKKHVHVCTLNETFVILKKKYLCTHCITYSLLRNKSFMLDEMTQ